MLLEALGLREEAGLPFELADSLNSLGSLKQRQHKYEEAERHYTHSLALRREVEPPPARNGQPSQGAAGAARWSDSSPEDERVKSRHQMIAQSLVSLGNLATERGDAEGGGGGGGSVGGGGGGGSAGGGGGGGSAGGGGGGSGDGDGDGGSGAGGGGPSAAARAHYAVARSHLEAAVEAYVLGFHRSHPKVAWAHEGLGRLHEKQGDLPRAIESFEAAVAIRRALQSQGGGKELFSQELANDAAALARLGASLAAGKPTPTPPSTPATGVHEVELRVAK